MKRAYLEYEISEDENWEDEVEGIWRAALINVWASVNPSPVLFRRFKMACLTKAFPTSFTAIYKINHSIKNDTLWSFSCVSLGQAGPYYKIRQNTGRFLYPFVTIFKLSEPNTRKRRKKYPKSWVTLLSYSVC